MRLFALLLLANAATGAGAAELFDRPADRTTVEQALSEPIGVLRRATVVRARFEQARHLSGFGHPLTSSGEMLFVRGTGIVWRVLEPFDSTSVFDRNGMRSGDGQAGPAPAAALRVLSGVLLSMLDLDVAALESRFEMFTSARSAGWILGLRPRDPGVADFAERMTISGRATLEHIELRDARGDRTEITFRDVTTAGGPATPRDLAPFEP
ncbi:MAG: hypothetical protein K0Q76_2898 [Panacagrimonas sp.]|nr:outer membrane lipoprotein carrier protein LolA [Panacagrimonas sp.]MCC2657790.1 hypothetical protein [Panacagrimonas sp.]